VYPSQLPRPGCKNLFPHQRRFACLVFGPQRNAILPRFPVGRLVGVSRTHAAIFAAREVKIKLNLLIVLARFSAYPRMFPINGQQVPRCAISSHFFTSLDKRSPSSAVARSLPSRVVFPHSFFHSASLAPLHLRSSPPDRSITHSFPLGH